MNSVGETFYLKASPETILQHLALSRGERPLLKGKSPEELREFIVKQLDERSPFYEQARHHIDVNVLDDFDKIGYVVNDIMKYLND